MTTLVTGATGFLGSALVKELLKQQQPVRILARNEQKASVALDVGKGTVASTLGSRDDGKSARLRHLPVITANDEAHIMHGNSKSNGHSDKASARRELRT